MAQLGSGRKLGFGKNWRLFGNGHRCTPARSIEWDSTLFQCGKRSICVLGYSDIGAAVGASQAIVPPFLAVGSRQLRREEIGMDTLELDPRLRHATAFLGKEPLMLIDGELVPAASGKTFAVYNPASGAIIANVPAADKADVDLAVAAARRAFDAAGLR
jgi:hypothetical protein